MLSTILYIEEATIAMIAGKEYCQSNEPMGFVPSSVGMCCRMFILMFSGAKVIKKHDFRRAFPHIIYIICEIKRV